MLFLILTKADDGTETPTDFNPHVPHVVGEAFQSQTNHDEFNDVVATPSEGVTNFRMINQCIKASAFKSQSLEKLYCFHMMRDTPADEYIVTDPKYNRLLQQLIYDNSKKYEGHFVDYKATYFTEESVYDNEIYPEFVKTLEKAKDDFEDEYARLRHRYFEDSFNSVRRNMYYLWRRVSFFFLSKAVFSANEGSGTLFKNIRNFSSFIRDCWINKDDSEFFKLQEFNDVFRTKFNDNLHKFTKFT